MKKEVKWIIGLSIVLIINIVICVILFINKKKEKIIIEDIKNLNIVLKEERKAEFLSVVKVSDFIDSIDYELEEDYEIDTTNIGEKEIWFNIKKDDKKIRTSYKIIVEDTIPPLIWLGNSYSISVGSKDNLLDKIMCADNYDDNPVCEIIGEYDTNVEGTYPLVFKAADFSGNTTEQKFNLYVYEPNTSGGSNSNYKEEYTYFEDVIKKFKTENTQIGIDVSRWQGDIDYEALKEAGVEFVIMRIGSSEGTYGERFMDSKFERNIKLANENNIPIGVYYFSYAFSKDKAIEEANWVLDNIKDYDVSLGVFFDWEDWPYYNDYKLSFYHLTDLAKGFMDTINKNGYKTYLYGSKNYLEKVWMETGYPVWLAHYNDETSYKGNFEYWQICQDGKVNGINGTVDINIRYLNKSQN